MKIRLARNNWGWLYVSATVLVLDQITKALIVRYLPPYQSMPLFPHFNLVNMHNTGAAFSMFNQAPALVFVVLAAAVTIGMLIWFWRHPHGHHFVAAGFSLILGGALGNALDRLTRGYVVDFVDFYVGHWHFAAFNVADSAITLGATCLVLDMLFGKFLSAEPDKS